jgi:hypothetical protein
MSKTCLIIGATSDIASAIAEEYAKCGYNLILAGIENELLNKIGQDIQIRYNILCQMIEFDILNLDSQQALIERIPELPEGIVFAVGYLGDQKESETNFEESKKVIDINYSYAVNLLNHFANEFEKRKSGFIVAISSVAGDRGRKTNYIYGAAKAALTAYLSGLRNRLTSSNVQVMTVKPGFVKTKMTSHLALPGKFTAEPKEVAQDVINGFKKKKDIVYTKKIYRYMLFVIKHIPESIFKKLSI